jgi:hypothetical protein
MFIQSIYSIRFEPFAEPRSVLANLEPATRGHSRGIAHGNAPELNSSISSIFTHPISALILPVEKVLTFCLPSSRKSPLDPADFNDQSLGFRLQRHELPGCKSSPPQQQLDVSPHDTDDKSPRPTNASRKRVELHLRGWRQHHHRNLGKEVELRAQTQVCYSRPSL